MNKDTAGGNDIEQLLDIMQTLRDPQKGCPWDLQQDFSSIAPYTIEEAYEVADAIERNNLAELKDELGDLLLQVVFHAQMANEQKAFSFADVVQAICDKMVRRHPHVFDPDQVSGNVVNAESVRVSWESIKERERAADGPGNGSGGLAASVLDSVPRGMAELQRACKLQKKAASAGFDWSSADEVLLKVQEEFMELKLAMQAQRQDEIQEEVGDLLFTVVNVARKLAIDPASALRTANAKFESRFRVVEHMAGGKAAMLAMEIETLERFWQTAKKQQK
jgi:ATP diphosphatase